MSAAKQKSMSPYPLVGHHASHPNKRRYHLPLLRTWCTLWTLKSLSEFICSNLWRTDTVIIGALK